MKTVTPSAPKTTAKRPMLIELLALDLKSCGRCTRTAANLDEAIGSVASILSEAGAEVRVEKHVVRTAEQAERLRFASSPTIRVNGRDIALELRESPCSDCGDLCGCGGGVDCRVWVWQGQEYLEAPKPMIIEAVLQAIARSDGPSSPATSFELPENLRTFFSAQSGKASGGPDGGCCGSQRKVQSCGC